MKLVQKSHRINIIQPREELMKKHIALLTLLSFTPPLLAATIPVINASQCSCTIKKHDPYFTCTPNSAGIISIYIGKIINNDHFEATTTIAPGQLTSAPITNDDGQTAIAYNSDGDTDSYVTADLSDFHSPASLTIIHYVDKQGSIYYPAESRCMNTQTCSYSTTIPGCLHPEIHTK